MDFLLAGGEMSKARAVTRRWNRENPERLVCWEWAEEAVIAWLQAMGAERQYPDQIAGHLQRYQEFAVRLPVGLQLQLFGRE